MVAPVLRTRGNPGHPALGRSSARRAWPRYAEDREGRRFRQATGFPPRPAAVPRSLCRGTRGRGNRAHSDAGAAAARALPLPEYTSAATLAEDRRRASSGEGLALSSTVLRREQTVGFVVDFHGDLTNRLAVLAHVVGAEQQLPAGVEHHSDIRLGAAAVTAVRSCQRPGGGKSSSHFAFLNLSALVTRDNI